MGAEITMFYQRTPKEIFPRNPPGYLSREPSGNFSLGILLGKFQGNDFREIRGECLRSVGHGQFLKMLHEHLQTDVISKDGRASCILTPGEHVVMRL